MMWCGSRLDPFIGGRMRHQFAPGRELILTGDVGGFGVGSVFSWQLVGTWSWNFATSQRTTWAAVVGYRSLYVDYTRGSGFSEMATTFCSTARLLGSVRDFYARLLCASEMPCRTAAEPLPPQYKI